MQLCPKRGWGHIKEAPHFFHLHSSQTATHWQSFCCPVLRQAWQVWARSVKLHLWKLGLIAPHWLWLVYWGHKGIISSLVSVQWIIICIRETSEGCTNTTDSQNNSGETMAVHYCSSPCSIGAHQACSLTCLNPLVLQPCDRQSRVSGPPGRAAMQGADLSPRSRWRRAPSTRSQRLPRAGWTRSCPVAVRHKRRKWAWRLYSKWDGT